jgi:hypothetical protein
VPPQWAVSRILSPASAPASRPELWRGDDHSSSPVIAGGIKRPTRERRTGRPLGPVARTRAPLFGLAPCGVLPATPVTRRAVRSYRTFSPLLVCPGDAGAPVSGVFSVPLSFELPRPGVTRRTTLRSSDFPLAFARYAGYGAAGPPPNRHRGDSRAGLAAPKLAKRAKAGDRLAHCGGVSRLFPA